MYRYVHIIVQMRTGMIGSDQQNKLNTQNSKQTIMNLTVMILTSLYVLAQTCFTDMTCELWNPTSCDN